MIGRTPADADPLDRIQDIYCAALARPVGERSAYLAAACAGDRELRLEVESLLAVGADASPFLESPAARLLPTADDADSDATELVGRHIGPYRLIRRLGGGGMGTVWLAERADAVFEKAVAVKLIRRGMDTAEILRRFRNERQLLASLDHPHIGRLLDGGATEDGRPYLVMEFVDGFPIDQYADEHRLDVPDRLRLFRQVCAAVHHAHQNLVVHRDLKPSNILVTADGEVKLLDFGIARLLPESGSLDTLDVTATAARLLTPRYASPEQIRGESLSTASDVYSLGVLLYELLTGTSPYEVTTRSRADFELAVCEQEPRRPSVKVARGLEAAAPPSERTRTAPSSRAGTDYRVDTRRLRRRLRGDLDNIVLMALRKEPHRRYASAEQLAADLERHEIGLPVRARPDTWAYRTSKFVRRNRLAAASLVVVFAVLVGAVAVTSSALVEQTRARGEALRQQQDAEESLRFLESMLASIDPSIARGGDISVLKRVLEEAEKRVDTELAQLPTAAARIHETIARVYTSLGLLDEAKRHANAALALRELLAGPDSLAVARCLNQRGMIAIEAGDLVDAERDHRRALDIAARQPGVGDDTHATALNGLGLLFHRKGEPQGALPYYEQAREFVRRVHGERSLRYALQLNNEASTFLSLGQYAEADQAFAQALAIREERLPPDHFDVAVSLQNLGKARSAVGDWQGAVELGRRALAIKRKLLEPSHPNLATTIVNLAAHLQQLQRSDEAIELLREALTIYRRAFPEPHAWTAKALSNLAVTLAKSGEIDEAEQLHREALAMRQQLYPDGHAEVALSYDSLAGLYSDSGRLDAAEPLYERALAIRRQHLGERHPLVAITLHNQSHLLLTLGRLDEAESACREAISIRAEKLPADHPSTAASHHVLAKILLAADRAEEALSEAKSAYEQLDRRLGSLDPQTARARVLATTILIQLGRHAEAEPILLSAYDASREAKGESFPATCDARSQLHDLYESWRRPADAARYAPLEPVREPPTEVPGTPNTTP
ncbi:MAG: tetratricopeptide repeat protein [Planctomycetota bacterium]